MHRIFLYIRKRRKGFSPLLLKLFLLALLNIDDLTALVLTASLASTMGHAECAAIGALDYAGSFQLPSRRTSLVTSLS